VFFSRKGPQIFVDIGLYLTDKAKNKLACTFFEIQCIYPEPDKTGDVNFSFKKIKGQDHPTTKRSDIKCTITDRNINNNKDCVSSRVIRHELDH